MPLLSKILGLAILLSMATAEVYPYDDGDDQWESQIDVITNAINECRNDLNWAIDAIPNINEGNLQYIFGDVSGATQGVVASVLHGIGNVCDGEDPLVVAWADESLFFLHNPPVTVTTTTTVAGPTSTIKTITTTSPTARCDPQGSSGPYGWIYPGGIVYCPRYFTLGDMTVSCFEDTPDTVLIRYLAAQPPLTNGAVTAPIDAMDDLDDMRRQAVLLSLTPLQRLSSPYAYQYYTSNVIRHCENGFPQFD